MTGIPAGWEIEQAPTPVAPPPVEPAPAPAPAAALPEGFEYEDEGLTGTVTYEPPPLATAPEQVQGAVLQMLKDGRPQDEIREWISGSGFSLDDATDAWMTENYDANRGRQDWSVAPPKVIEPIDAGTAALSGLQAGALGTFDDEWKAFWGAAGNKLGGVLGMNNSDADFWDIYETLQEQNEAYKNEAYNQNPMAYGAGFLPGMLVSPGGFAGMRAGRALINAGRSPVVASAAGGAIAAAESGAGNADNGIINRAIGAGQAAPVGAAFGGLMQPVANAGATILSRLAERVRPTGGARAANTGLDALASRAPQEADAMLARAAEMEAAGVPPRLVDVVDESGRGVIRDASSKMTPARDEVVRHADDVYTSAQDRVANQAREHISPAPFTARTIAANIASEQTQLGPRFDAVRNLPVQLTPEVIQVFATNEGRAVLGRVARYMTAREQDSLRAFSGAIRNAANLDPSLPPAIREQITRQLMEGNPLTVDIADKFARIVRLRAKDEGMVRVAEDMANTVRGAARAQHREYDAALIDFQRLGGISDAAAGTGRFEGDDFLKAAPDVYARNRGAAGSETITVQGPEGPVTYPSEDTLSRVRARDEVVDRATSGSGAQAVGTARQLSQGSAQRQRNEALLGEEGARRFESGMREEVTRVRNTDFVDPRRGSQTHSRGEDANAADDAMNFISDAATSNIWGPVRGVARWFREKGIRGIDAERLVRDAISEDPVRLREAIDHLARRGVSHERARSLVRAIQAGAAGRAAGAITAPEQERPAAGSVRIMMREGNRR